jgi:hypothetical protein
MTATNPGKYLPPRLTRIEHAIQRETRQMQAALALNNRRKALEHQDRIDRLTSERAIMADRYAAPLESGAITQTEMML